MDLSQRVAPRLREADYGRGGFLDTTIDLGRKWPDELREALRTARVFVPLLSPAFFDSEFCGKEWAAFQQRLAAQGDPPLVLPVLFVPETDLRSIPGVVAPVTRWTQDFGSEYLSRGLMGILPSPDPAPYDTFLARFADALVSAVTEHPVSPGEAIATVDEVQSAFHDPKTREQLVVKTREPDRWVFAQFIYVAAPGPQLQRLRSDVTAYGDNGGQEWQPYLPIDDAEVGMIAGEVASAERFRYEPVALDGSLVERVLAAIAAKKIVVVVVDPWTICLDTYQELMAELDQLRPHNCIVLVPLNESDDDTSRHLDGLKAAVNATFPSHVVDPRPEIFTMGLPTHETFRDDLARKLTGTKMQMIRIDEVQRSVSPVRSSLPRVTLVPEGPSS